MHDIYREVILDHYKNPRNFGEMKNPDAAAEKDNPLCGDEIKIDIQLTTSDQRQTTIKNIRFSGHGCAISMASASMLTEKVKDMQIEDLLKYTKDDIVNLLGFKLTPARIKCAVLPLEVTHIAINNYGKIKD